MVPSEVLIPFSGLYCTPHESVIDYAHEQLLQDDSGDVHPDLKGIEPRAWAPVLDKYVREYVAQIAHQVPELKRLVFKEMISPREYNFTNDKLVGLLPDEDVQAIYDKTDKKELDDLIRDQFTHRSGFHSAYPNSREAWGDLATWDDVQRGTLLQAFLLEHYTDDIDFNDLVDACRIEDWIYDMCSEEDKKRIDNVREENKQCEL